MKKIRANMITLCLNLPLMYRNLNLKFQYNKYNQHSIVLLTKIPMKVVKVALI